MTLADIPEELVIAFAQALRDATPGTVKEPVFPDGPFAAVVRAALPAVLPIHEQMVREQIAKELLADRTMTNREISDLRALDLEDEYHEDCGDVFMTYAARIARGTSTPINPPNGEAS